MNKTNDSFMENFCAFVDQFFAPTARDNQLEYLRNALKPFGMTTEALAARLHVVSHLGQLLPGSYDANNQVYLPLYSSETEYKQALFGMMLMAWRIKFAESAFELDDDNYSYSQLTHYLSLQKAIEKRAHGNKCSHQNMSCSGRVCGSNRGCGRGRFSGGRGFGSGGQGFNGCGYGPRPYNQGFSYGYQGGYSSYNVSLPNRFAS